MSARRSAFVVVDLGFGDAGKGLLTDYLVRSAQAKLVVRFNGGAQAGHNVVTSDGRHHTFSQFGSGSFVPGVKTHLARPLVIHPTALRVEAEHLARVGESDALARLSVDPECRVTTPFQQAAGRLRELLRGDARHGSCGVGVGETVKDSLESPELTLRFGDLFRPERARERVFAQRALKLREFPQLRESPLGPDLAREYSALTDPELADRWLLAAAQVAQQVHAIRDESLEPPRGSVVFEGAQGMLLDEHFGFHPYTTFSQCGFGAALELAAALGFQDDVRRIGVLRSYAVRHGPGPLPTEDAEVALRTAESHNQSGPWQKQVRKGWPDLVLLDYALQACGGVDELAITHLDALSALPDYRYCFAYAGQRPLGLPAGLVQQQALTEQLFAAEPSYRNVAAARLCELIAERCGTFVGYTSSGPTATDVARHNPRI